MTAKYGTPYFSNYINSDMEPSDIRSMCPLSGDTEILVKSSGGVTIQTIYQLANNQLKRNTPYQVWTPDGWRAAKFNRQPMTKMYAVELSNGDTILMGENHLQPVKGGETKPAKELQVGEWLPFNKKPIPADTYLGTYDLGFAVGAYAGDGSHDDGALVYSLDRAPKDDETERRLVSFWNRAGYKTNVTFNKKVRFVRVNGNAYDVVSLYIEGADALTKRLSNKVFDMSIEFREGLLDGYRATDGARAEARLYTSSPELRKNLMTLLTSLGRKALGHYSDSRPGRLGTSTNYRVDYPMRSKLNRYYDEDEHFHYFQIKSIKETTNKDQTLYCLEVDNPSHIFMLANGLFTHNCRLRLDLRELRKKSGGYFGSGESTGAVGVVSVNLPRLGYLAKDEKDFYERLDQIMDLSARSLDIKRKAITEWLEKGLYPYTKRYLGDFHNHFSTIATVGGNECCLNAKWIGKDLSHPESQQFMKDVLNHMRERLSDYQEKYGDLFNLEAAPAESTAYRFAKHDKERYPDIITAESMDGVPYYTNSTHLPVGYTEDVFTALEIQDELQTLYTSGTVFHAFLGEKLPDWKAAATLVRKIAENFKLPYYTISPTYSVCSEHGYINGEVYNCPKCGKPTEVYSRITGYYRPVQNWNDGKVAEFKMRKTYEIAGGQNFFQPMTNNEPTLETVEECAACVIPRQAKLVLYGTKTCPNCKAAMKFLDEHGVTYEKKYAEDDPEFGLKHGIRQAPTLVEEVGKKVRIVTNLSNIMKYIRESY